MKLELFNFIDDTIAYYDRKQASYEYVEGRLKELYAGLFNLEDNQVVSIHSRIKNKDSLREKLIRNHFYLDYHSPKEAIDHLTDLIGITLECRFIRNEAEIYQKLFSYFKKTDKEFAQCNKDEDVYLNLNMRQPQIQRNGFTIYRLDGYCLFNGERVNYELQIKSLVHNFWSDIEHEVVYKNPDFVMYDQFNKEMLGAIRDNLDVVDRQLEIMYNEISHESRSAQIGMDEKGFKVFVARSINEIVNRNMKESVGFATDFKKASAIIAQYIYIRDFVNGDNNQEKMVEYFSVLNYLNSSKIDFSEKIELEHPYESDDPFCHILGDYWQKQLNTNFQWHIFFAMIFVINPGNNLEDFSDFVSIIRTLLIQPGWFADTFSSFTTEEGDEVRDLLTETLAQALVDTDKIEIVHEDMLYECMLQFRKFTNDLDKQYDNQKDLMKDKEKIRAKLYHNIRSIFA